MGEFSIRSAKVYVVQLWRSLPLIVLATLAGAFLGLAYTEGNATQQRYQAIASVSAIYRERTTGGGTMSNYVDLVGSRLVCERAAEMIGEEGLSGDRIQGMISSWVGSNSYVMFINATTNNPQRAVQVANAVANAFIQQVSDLSGSDSLQILDQAATAVAMENKTVSTVRLISVAAPFVLACGLVILIELMTNKVRLISQCAEDTDEILGIVPYVK